MITIETPFKIEDLGFFETRSYIAKSIESCKRMNSELIRVGYTTKQSNILDLFLDLSNGKVKEIWFVVDELNKEYCVTVKL